jgi:ferredoxin
VLAADRLYDSRPGVLHQEYGMKIRIDKAACVGNARCAAVAPELYPLDENGYIAVSEIDVPAGKEALARRGARACPERIIVVEEDDESGTAVR